MNTDGHRFSEALASCTRSGVGETIRRGLSLVAPKLFLSVSICVNLWLKNFLLHAPQKPSISSTKICENPSKTPHRQASSSLNFFVARPALPPPPSSILNHQFMAFLCLVSVPLCLRGWIFPRFHGLFCCPLRAFVSSCEMLGRGSISANSCRALPPFASEKPSKSASPIFLNPFNINGGSNLIKPNQTKKNSWDLHPPFAR
jgi:hypothetical protein